MWFDVDISHTGRNIIVCGISLRMTVLITLGCWYRYIICCARCWDRRRFYTDLLLVCIFPPLLSLADVLYANFSKPAYNTRWTATLDLIRYNNGGGIKFLRIQWIGKARRFDGLRKAQLLGVISFLLFWSIRLSSDLICYMAQDNKMVVFGSSFYVFTLYR